MIERRFGGAHSCIAGAGMKIGSKRSGNEELDAKAKVQADPQAPAPYRKLGSAQSVPGATFRQDVHVGVFLGDLESSQKWFAPSQKVLADKVKVGGEREKEIEKLKGKAQDANEEGRRAEAFAESGKAMRAEARLERDRFVATQPPDELAAGLAEVFAGQHPNEKTYAQRRDEFVVDQQGGSISVSEGLETLARARSDMRRDEAMVIEERYARYEEQLLSSVANREAMLESGMDGSGKPLADADRVRINGEIERMGKEIERAQKVRVACMNCVHENQFGRREEARKAFMEIVKLDRSGGGQGPFDGKLQAFPVKGQGVLMSVQDHFRALWGSREAYHVRSASVFAGRTTMAGYQVAKSFGQAVLDAVMGVANAMQGQDLEGLVKLGRGGMVALSGPLKVASERRAHIAQSAGRVREMMQRSATRAQTRNQTRMNRFRKAEKESQETLEASYRYLDQVQSYLTLCGQMGEAKTQKREAVHDQKITAAEENLKRTYNTLKHQYPAMARALGLGNTGFSPEVITKKGQAIKELGRQNRHDYLERVMEASGVGIPKEEALHGDWKPVVDLGPAQRGLSDTVGDKTFEGIHNRIVATCGNGEVRISVVGVHKDDAQGGEWGDADNALGEKVATISSAHLQRGVEALGGDFGEAGLERLQRTLGHPEVVSDGEYERLVEAREAAKAAMQGRLAGVNEKDREAMAEAFELASTRLQAVRPMGSLSSEERERVMKDREAYEPMLQLLGYREQVGRDGTRVLEPLRDEKGNPVGGYLSEGQVECLGSLAQLHADMGGFGMLTCQNDYHRAKVAQWNSKLAEAVGEPADRVGFQVQPAKEAAMWMADLADAMGQVRYKNAEEMLRLINQMRPIIATMGEAGA